MKPLLYSGTRNASSWAMRAWLALRAAGVDFEEEVVDIRRPQRFANLARVGRVAPPAMVPVFVVDDTAIFDSLAIMEFANDASGGALLPVDPLRRAQARSLVAWQHSGLSGICARISFESSFYPERRYLSPKEGDECARLFHHLETLAVGHDGPHLFGRPSLADFALTPTVIRLTRHAADLTRWPGVRRWTEAILADPDVRDWLAEADRLPHIWYDDYLLPDTPIAMHAPGSAGRMERAF